MSCVLASACGGGQSAPTTHQGLAELALKALTERNIEHLESAMPTPEDGKELAERNKLPFDSDEFEARQKKFRGHLKNAFQVQLRRVAGANIAWANVRLGDVKGQPVGPAELRAEMIKAPLTGGGAEERNFELNVTAMKTARGYVLSEAPRLRFDPDDAARKALLMEEEVLSVLEQAKTTEDALASLKDYLKHNGGRLAGARAALAALKSKGNIKERMAKHDGVIRQLAARRKAISERNPTLLENPLVVGALKNLQ